MKKLVKHSWTRIRNIIAVLSFEMMVVLTIFFIAFFFVIFLIREVFYEKAFSLDEEAFTFLRKYISERANSTMSFFTIFGSHKFLVPANLSLIGYAFLVLKDKWFGIKITAIAISSLALMFGLKYLFGRPRPLEPLLSPASGLSFPSGHAFMSFAFFGLLIYAIYKKMGNHWLRQLIIALLLSFVIIICISRIYLRVHYLSDVLAGLCLGMMWLVISLLIINKLEKREKRQLPVQ